MENLKHAKASLWRNIGTGRPPNPLFCSFSLRVIFFQNSRFTEIIRHCNSSSHVCLLDKMASKTMWEGLIYHHTKISKNGHHPCVAVLNEKGVRAGRDLIWLDLFICFCPWINIPKIYGWKKCDGRAWTGSLGLIWGPGSPWTKQTNGIRETRPDFTK